MEDAGFIIGSYAVAFVAIAGYAWRVLQRAGRAAARLPDDAKPWT